MTENPELLASAREQCVEIARQANVSIRYEVDGKRVTTLAIGGPLRAIVEPDSAEEFARVIAAASREGLSYRILGAGSNILIPDEGVPDLIVKAGKRLRNYAGAGSGRFVVSAAMPLMTLARELSVAGYSGLEFAAGIPASLGGAVRMNAGAHGGEISDVLESVVCVLSDGATVELDARELDCRYRFTALPEGAAVIAATLQLVESSPQQTARRRQELLEERKRRQPLTQPSCGSVFKNPSPDKTAGWYLEQAGLKGHSLGGAEVSKMHANWIVNPNRSASAREVLELVSLCQKGVQEQFNLTLEPELVRW